MEGLTERIVKAIVFTDTKTIARGLLSPSLFAQLIALPNLQKLQRLSHSLFARLISTQPTKTMVEDFYEELQRLSQSLFAPLIVPYSVT